MSTDIPKIRCDAHGEQPETFVCQHIFKGLIAKQRAGFFWTPYDPGNPRPDAWCTECEDRVKLTNGEWVGEAEAHLQPKLLCGECYDLAKVFHLGGNPWS
jgi:hypothetical protein